MLMARTLAQESRLILLDEPTNHLDIRFQYLLMEILKKQDATIFSSVHDLNIAAMYCDRILLMDRGRIIKAGTPEEILTEENILQILESMRRSRKIRLRKRYKCIIFRKDNRGLFYLEKPNGFDYNESSYGMLRYTKR